ncbi:MAG TPA: hypothetical protein VGY30_00405 [Solirubrobacteraceae bacterium]|jgi:hypothetical protein|nr:hypothetical protein [Solirubrobacteraceae bacterium]
MREVLVIANRTLGGEKLLDMVRAQAAAGDVVFRLVVPQTKPAAGLVIYDEAVRESAQVRVDLAMSLLAGEGIAASGEVGDPDPFMAAMDAIAQRRPDEVIVSTHPATQSGWLRRDLIERIERASGLPVEHIVVDLEHEDLPFAVTLVIADKTSSGEELISRLSAKAADGRQRMFIAVVPQQDRSGSASRAARLRLAAMLERLDAVGLLSAGMIGDPDPYTAVMNALELFNVDDIVISTLPGERSGWMRSDLIGRVRGASLVEVEHVVVDTQPNATAAAAG